MFETLFAHGSFHHLCRCDGRSVNDKTVPVDRIYYCGRYRNCGNFAYALRSERTPGSLLQWDYFRIGHVRSIHKMIFVKIAYPGDTHAVKGSSSLKPYLSIWMPHIWPLTKLSFIAWPISCIARYLLTFTSPVSLSTVTSAK